MYTLLTQQRGAGWMSLYSDADTIRPLLLHNDYSSSVLMMPFAYSRASPQKSHSTTLRNMSHVRSKVLTAPSTPVHKRLPGSALASSPSSAFHYAGYKIFVYIVTVLYISEKFGGRRLICSPTITKVDVGHAYILVRVSLRVKHLPPNSSTPVQKTIWCVK